MIYIGEDSWLYTTQNLNIKILTPQYLRMSSNLEAEESQM